MPELIDYSAYQVGEEQIECFLCGKQNGIGAPECRNCSAPASVSLAYCETPSTPPKVVMTLGAPGVGKSVFLGMLLDAIDRDCPFAQQPAGEGGNVDSDDFDCDDIDSDDAPPEYSLHSTVTESLARGAFPMADDLLHWDWASRNDIVGKKKTQKVFFPDFPGIAVIEDYEGRRSWPIISRAIVNSVGAMVLIDAAAVVAGDEDEQFFALHLLRYYTDERKQVENDLVVSQRNKAPIKVAVVFTKTDQCSECAEDPEEFAREWLPDLWQACQDQLSKHKYFAVRIPGVCTEIRNVNNYINKVPLRIEPFGILAPFQWLLGKK